VTRRSGTNVAIDAGDQIERNARRNPTPSTAPACAVMELLGQRWTLRVIWELDPGALRFLELRDRMANCSSSVLSERLRQLSARGLVVKSEEGRWELTVAGDRLRSALMAVRDWAEEWAREKARPALTGSAACGASATAITPASAVSTAVRRRVTASGERPEDNA
jgi:DNA-binding HxlR family transcriptional regulator